MKFTDEQMRIITAPKGNILVSAAAGSGKTAVLTERIVSRIENGDLDPDRVLVLTFTENAATNMRQKIEARLLEAVQSAPSASERVRLSEQLARLPLAAISTIHAFCLKTLRDFAHLLVDPQTGDLLIRTDIRVMSAEDADVLLSESVDAVLHNHYIEASEAEEKMSDFLKTVDCYGGGRDDTRLRQLLIASYKKLRSMADYRSLIEDLSERFRRDYEDFSGSGTAAFFFEQLRILIARYRAIAPELKSLLRDPGMMLIKDAKKDAERKAELAECLERLDTLSAYVTNTELPDWDRVSRMGSLIGFHFPLRASEEKDTEKKLRTVKLLRSEVGELIHFLNGSCASGSFKENFALIETGVFHYSTAAIREDMAAMAPVIKCFAKLLSETDEVFARAKQQRGFVDFADFEHYALFLLRCPEVREYYRNVFTEIYVDEFQDTSSIQNAILTELSTDNLFVVGDLKQSIYRFRHARPELFQRIQQAYQKNEQAGSAYELHRNFRSTNTILHAVNQVFHEIMCGGITEINYRDGHAFEVVDGMMPEAKKVVWVTGCKEEDEKERSTKARSYKLLVETVRMLMTDGRKPGEIAVLMRTNQGCKDLVNALSRAGIRASSNTRIEYRDTYEINLLTALVEVLSNAAQDYSLLAVLRSPLLSQPFDEAALAEIRSAWLQSGGDRYANFSEIIFSEIWQAAAPVLFERVGGFRKWLDGQRRLLSVRRISVVLHDIIRQTGLYEQLAVLPDGAQRIENVQMFENRARLYEQGYRTDIAGFNRFLSQHDDFEIKQTKVSPEDALRLNVVTVITTHASKGLEFPVVVIGDMERNLRQARRVTGGLDFSERLGISFDVFRERDDVMYSWCSVQRLAADSESSQSRFAEELRLLYVAMTRAEEELYFVSADLFSDVKKHDSAPATEGSYTYSPAQLVALPSYNLLIYAALLNAGEFTRADFRRLGEAETTEDSLSGRQNWKIRILIPEDEPGTDLRSRQPARTSSGDLLTFLRDAAQSAAEPAAKAPETANLPLKVSVSEIKRRAQALQEDELPDAGLPLRAVSLVPLEIEEGAVAEQKSRLTATELGTALHKAFRFLDIGELRSDPSAEAALRQLQVLRAEGTLSDLEWTALLPYAESLLLYAQSTLAEEVLQAEAAGPEGEGRGLGVYREMPFTLTLPASQLYPEATAATADHIMVQGMIDLWFEADKCCTVVDYKSDRIPYGADPQTYFIEQYQTQLKLYAEAVRRATGLPVARGIIWSIRQGRMYVFEV